MKIRILSTVAAALIAGVAGLTLATGASANHGPPHKLKLPGPPKKLKLSGLCQSANGGILTNERRSLHIWWREDCVILTVGTKNRQYPVRAKTEVRFNAGVFSKCTNSVLIVNFYKRSLPGKWQLVQTVKAYGVKKFNKCKASVITKYASGMKIYRVIIRTVNGDGNKAGAKNEIMTKMSLPK